MATITYTLKGYFLQGNIAVPAEEIALWPRWDMGESPTEAIRRGQILELTPSEVETIFFTYRPAQVGQAVVLAPGDGAVGIAYNITPESHARIVIENGVLRHESVADGVVDVLEFMPLSNSQGVYLFQYDPENRLVYVDGYPTFTTLDVINDLWGIYVRPTRHARIGPILDGQGQWTTEEIPLNTEVIGLPDSPDRAQRVYESWTEPFSVEGIPVLCEIQNQNPEVGFLTDSGEWLFYPDRPVAFYWLYPATLPPPAPGNFRANRITKTSIEWAWNDPSTYEQGFDIYDENDNLLVRLPADTTSWLEEGLEPDTEYTRKIVAYNINGVSDIITATARTLAAMPERPSWGIAVRQEANKVILAWAPIAEAEYVDIVGEDGIQILASFPAQDLKGTYEGDIPQYIAVRARAGGYVSGQTIFPIDRKDGDSDIPIPTLKGIISTQVSIMWFWDVPPDVTGIRIYNEEHKPIISLPAGVSEYTEEGLMPGSRVVRYARFLRNGKESWGSVPVVIQLPPPGLLGDVGDDEEITVTQSLPMFVSGIGDGDDGKLVAIKSLFPHKLGLDLFYVGKHDSINDIYETVTFRFRFRGRVIEQISTGAGTANLTLVRYEPKSYHLMVEGHASEPVSGTVTPYKIVEREDGSTESLPSDPIEVLDLIEGENRVIVQDITALVYQNEQPTDTLIGYDVVTTGNITANIVGNTIEVQAAVTTEYTYSETFTGTCMAYEPVRTLFTAHPDLLQTSDGRPYTGSNVSWSITDLGTDAEWDWDGATLTVWTTEREVKSITIDVPESGFTSFDPASELPGSGTYGIRWESGDNNTYARFAGDTRRTPGDADTSDGFLLGGGIVEVLGDTRIISREFDVFSEWFDGVVNYDGTKKDFRTMVYLPDAREYSNVTYTVEIDNPEVTYYFVETSNTHTQNPTDSAVFSSNKITQQILTQIWSGERHHYEFDTRGEWTIDLPPVDQDPNFVPDLYDIQVIAEPNLNTDAEIINVQTEPLYTRVVVQVDPLLPEHDTWNAYVQPGRIFFHQTPAVLVGDEVADQIDEIGHWVAAEDDLGPVNIVPQLDLEEYGATNPVQLRYRDIDPETMEVAVEFNGQWYPVLWTLAGRKVTVHTLIKYERIRVRYRVKRSVAFEEVEGVLVTHTHKPHGPLRIWRGKADVRLPLNLHPLTTSESGYLVLEQKPPRVHQVLADIPGGMVQGRVYSIRLILQDAGKNPIPNVPIQIEASGCELTCLNPISQTDGSVMLMIRPTDAAVQLKVTAADHITEITVPTYSLLSVANMRVEPERNLVTLNDIVPVNINWIEPRPPEASYTPIEVSVSGGLVSAEETSSAASSITIPPRPDGSGQVFIHATEPGTIHIEARAGEAVGSAILVVKP